MTFLTPHLPFGGPSSSFEPTAPSSKASQAISPPPGSHLIVSDTLNSPAHFVLFHLVLAANAAKRRVVWVDFRSEGRSSWDAALRKLVRVAGFR
jgi:hypothetical protein